MHQSQGQKKPANLLTPQALRNWPVQSHAAEILRLAVTFASERGVRVLQTLHDALYIEAPLKLIDEHVRLTQEAMIDAGRVILWDFDRQVSYDLNVKHQIVRYPDHWHEKGMGAWWETLRTSLLKLSGVDIEGREG
jgi:hypothetical protein